MNTQVRPEEVSTHSTHSMETLDWLLDHHQTKEKERQTMIADLRLCPGDRLLDLGCGPGLWAEPFMEQVAPDGSVVGLDHDPNYIRHAKSYNQASRYRDKMTFEVADFYQIPYPDRTFDMVFCGNCFQFVQDQVEFLEEIQRVTKKGGRISEKSYDGSMLLFYPMDTVLLHRVLAATAHSLAKNPARPPFDVYFDNYVGRKNRGLFRRAGLANVTTHAYAIQKYFPLSGPERRYIAGNARWYLDTGRELLTEREIAEWAACFDSDSGSYIMDSEDFYYCMVEIMTIGTVE